jgi:N-acetylglucosamine-6-phosphate deacetylase
MSISSAARAIAFVGGLVATPSGLLRHDVRIDSGVITDIGPSVDTTHSAVIDVSGHVVAPGFIDTQCNGANGIDLASEPHRLWEFADSVVRWGVTTVLPTFITSPLSTYGVALATFRAEPPSRAGARVPGLHLEGPFLNPHMAGAHGRKYMLMPPDHTASETNSAVEFIDRWGPNEVALVTLAPELHNATKLIRTLSERGITVSTGHTAATYAQVVTAADAGLRGITHLFNAMSPLHHREPGCVGAALDDERLIVGLICDGVHVDPAAVRTAWKALGPERLVLVSDAIAALGMIDFERTSDLGALNLGGVKLTVTPSSGPDGTASVRLANGTLAGSVLSMDHAVRNLIAFTGCSLHDALRCATANPARLLRRTDIGTLQVGALGDVIVLDSTTRVRATFIDGIQVFGDQMSAHRR